MSHYNPGSEMHYKMLWDGMIEMGHNPKIRPMFLASVSGFIGKCRECGMGGFSGEEVYGNQRFFGLALDNKCPVNKEN